MKSTHYLCDIHAGTITYAGPLPETWGTMASLPQEGSPDLLDLTWAGHPHQGFLTYQQAVNVGIAPEVLGRQRVTVLDIYWREIQALRDQKYLGGVQVGGKWFHTDADSRQKYLEMKDQARDLIAGGSALTTLISAGGAAREWKTLDGSKTTMTLQMIYEIVDAARNFNDAVFTASEKHRSAMCEAVDPALYDYSRNWPAVFMG